MNRLIIDITELAGWQGKLTGVPRVMNELCNRFARLNGDVRFVIWDGEAKDYCRISFLPKGNEPSATNESTPKRGIKTSAINIARKFKNSSRFTSYALTLPKYAARKLAIAKRPNLTKDIMHLQKGDILLVLADWHANDPAFLSYLVRAHGQDIKLVQMVYDLLPIVTPQYAGHATTYVTNYAKLIYPLCELIITISDNTKKDITVWLKQNKLNTPKIQVIRLGDDFLFAQPTAPTDRMFQEAGLKMNDFLLCVGTVEARKNHTLLYLVYKLAAARKIVLPKLIIVGRLGWQAENIYEMIKKDPEVKDSLIMLEDINDNQLSWLYEHCLFTIYPSFYEGWGLPIAESVARGVPCISSKTSSMPEIAGNLIKYFNPASPDECLVAVQRLLKPQELVKAREKLTKYRPISWEQTYEQVNEAIKEIYAKN